jgi:hypothetical protein
MRAWRESNLARCSGASRRTGSDLASCDQETLKVADLQSGQYTLTIDKMKVGTFSADRLANGVNFALLKTPMWNQAREYHGNLERRSRLEDADLILSADTEVKDKATAASILRQGEAEFEQKVKAGLRVAKHHYTLTPLNQTSPPKP